MAKAVKSLTGAAKDAFLRRAVARAGGLEAATAETIAAQLGAEVSRLWVRVEALEDEPAEADAAAVASASRGAAAEVASRADAAEAPTFDPYTPNVIVMVRTAGAAGALEALSVIADIANLRLLAREQQLGIEAELQTADEIRTAIVAAAERRIANRRAAAS